MSRWTLILKSLWHHRRIHLPVLIAVAIATAVLTGALIVGDSVRGSLKDLALERLGIIDQVLVGSRFFSQDQADKLASYSKPAPADDSGEMISSACILVKATAETSGGQSLSRVRNVTLIGFDETFWELNGDAEEPIPSADLNSVIINQALADELAVSVGDRVTLRLPDANQVQADSALGRKDDRVRSLPSRIVAEILPNRRLGKFSLHPTQQTTFNAFVPIQSVQKTLDIPGKANTLFVANAPQKLPQLDLELDDFGIGIKRGHAATSEQSHLRLFQCDFRPNDLGFGDL